LATIEIVIANRDHLDAVADCLRPADRQEIWAATLATPHEALDISLSFSTLAWTGLIDGVPFVMFGVAAASPWCRHGIPWLLSGPQIEIHRTAALRLCRRYIKEIAEQHPILANFVDARNRTSIRWLKWLGFTVKPAIPYGPFNLLFHPFEMRS